MSGNFRTRNWSLRFMSRSTLISKTRAPHVTWHSRGRFASVSTSTAYIHRRFSPSSASMRPMIIQQVIRTIAAPKTLLLAIEPPDRTARRLVSGVTRKLACSSAAMLAEAVNSAAILASKAAQAASRGFSIRCRYFSFTPCISRSITILVPGGYFSSATSAFLCFRVSV